MGITNSQHKHFMLPSTFQTKQIQITLTLANHTHHVYEYIMCGWSWNEGFSIQQIPAITQKRVFCDDNLAFLPGHSARKRAVLKYIGDKSLSSFPAKFFSQGIILVYLMNGIPKHSGVHRAGDVWSLQRKKYVRRCLDAEVANRPRSVSGRYYQR